MNGASVLQAELERRILHGLACEYDEARGLLDDGLRQRLRRPLFALGDLKGRWGQWVADKREICLSRDLVLKYSWGAVREVLRHEMAHQLAALIDRHNGRPHGEAFREACRRLRADPAATANYRMPDGSPAAATSSPEDRLRIRVQKLFALADSPNPHEAASAMRKARELLARHGGDAPPRPWDERHVSILLGAAALRHYRDDYLLAHLLMDLYAVEGVWVPAYVLDKGRMGRALEISGRPSQVQVADYAYDFVRRFITRSWHQAPALRSCGQRARRDFAAGVIEGFRAKMSPAPANPGTAPPAAAALVPRDDPALATYLRQRYPHLRRFRRQLPNHDPDAYAAGLDRGRRLVIREGIARNDPPGPPARLPAGAS